MSAEPQRSGAAPVACDAMSHDRPPTPGATVVPLREGPDGLEVLMIERAAALAYGGMWAFPGGRVDPDDADPSDPDDEVARARRAAVREAHEEVGLQFAPESLVTYSHWTGGATHGRLFAAWYFLAPAPDASVVLDEHECTDHGWVRPVDAVAARDRGEIAVVAPTWMTLHSLLAARHGRRRPRAGPQPLAGRLPVAGHRRRGPADRAVARRRRVRGRGSGPGRAAAPARHERRRLVVRVVLTDAPARGSPHRVPASPRSRPVGAQPAPSAGSGLRATTSSAAGGVTTTSVSTS